MRIFNLFVLLSLFVPSALCVVSRADEAASAEAAAGEESATVNEAVVDGAMPAAEVASGDAAEAKETVEGDSNLVDSNEGEPAEPPPTIDNLPWAERPYRVLVSVAIADHGVLSRGFVDELRESMTTFVSGTIGPYWELTIEENGWLYPATGEQIERLTGTAIIDQHAETKFDKLLLIAIESSGPTFVLTGREWDRSTEQIGPVETRRVVDHRRLSAEIGALAWELFRPIAEIEFTEGTFAELRARGAELLSPESSLFPFRPGDLLTGHFRYLDRDRKVRKIQPVPWSYIRVTDLVRSRLTCEIETAFSNPFAGSRRRVELMAVRVRPTHEETTLSLAPRTNPGKPLVGVRVRVLAELPTKENPKPERIDLMTDRFGRVTIPAYPDAPLRRMLVHSGGAVLSNVPFVPGVESTVSMLLPDDSPRLEVEGNLAMVQGDLIDVVSRRAVMMARAVSLAKKEQFEEVDRLMREVDQQPSIASFESRILAIRVPAIDQSRANRDRSQEKRIRMMCKDVESLVNKYLDREKVKEVKEEIRELKKLAGK